MIDIGLWNRAGWTGTAFFSWGANSPPAFALVFTDAEAARKIFERWRARFGPADENDDIYIAVVRGISMETPTHYRVIITSRVRTDLQAGSQQLLITSRIQTMQPASDANLNRFLDMYHQVGAYLLAPAVLNGNPHPELLLDLAVLKQELSVKAASEIGENDVEAIALWPANPPSTEQ